jgi:uncharacterized protein GlcG (DUF336 family)
MNLYQANTVIAAALKKGAELGLKPLSVAVLDAGGHLVAFQRSDHASNLRFQIAYAKASGALDIGVSSRRLGQMAAERPSFIASLGPIATQGLIPVAGGVIVLNEDGHPMGAVGVTGDSSDNDELCALAGIAAAGLRAQT